MLKKFLSDKIELLLLRFGYYSEAMLRMRLLLERNRMGLATCPNCDCEGNWGAAFYTCLDCSHTYSECEIISTMREKTLANLFGNKLG